MPRIISPDALLLDEEGDYYWTPDRVDAAWEAAYTDLAETLENPAVSKLVLLVGPPGAGKTTWLRQQAKTDALDHNAIYFDATLTKMGRRSVLVRFAQAAGVPLEAVVFLTPEVEVWRRNASRDMCRRVPWTTMSVMISNMRSQPVTVEEGFTLITVIS